MKKEINPVMIGVVIAVAVIVIAGALWKSNQTDIIEHPKVSSPATMLKR